MAEDLGVQSDRVRELLKFVGYPGMKVATFGFGGDADGNQHFPGNWSENYVAYTGTHDNDTTAGWIATADETTLKAAKDYLHFDAACYPPRAAWRLCRCRTYCIWAAKPA